jgi:hypothetical protein
MQTFNIGSTGPSPSERSMDSQQREKLVAEKAKKDA